MRDTIITPCRPATAPLGNLPTGKRWNPAPFFALVFVCFVVGMIGCIWWWNQPSAPVPEAPLSAEEQIYGRKPQVITVGPGRVVSVALSAHLRGQVKDPESLEILACTEPTARDFLDQKGWAVAVEYRAKNSFGGYVVERRMAIIREERVILWESMK